MKSRALKLITRLNKLSKEGKGFTLIELSAVSILLIIITALGLDLGILIFASDACDKACKDCARAAGTGGRTPGQAIDAMNAALAIHVAGLNSFTMSNLQAQLMVYEDYSTGTPNTTSGGTSGPWETTTGTVLPTNSSTSSSGGTAPSPNTPVTIWLTNNYSRTAYSPGPYVCVRCTMNATVPAPIFFFGKSVTPNQIQVASVYAYPLTNTYSTVLATASVPLKNPNQANSTSTVSANSTNTTAAASSASTTNASSTSNANANSTSTTNASTSTNRGSGTTSSSASTSNNSTSTHNSTSTNSSNNTATSASSTSNDRGSGTSTSSNSTVSNTQNSSSNSTGTTAANSNSTTTNASNTSATSAASNSNSSTGSTNNTATNANSVNTANSASTASNASNSTGNSSSTQATVMGQSNATGDHG